MDPETSPARMAPDAEPRWRPRVETVLIRVPADPDYLPVVRSATAHVGTKLGCTLSEVSDLRLAVDEACGLLLRHTVPDVRADGSGDLECRFLLDDPSLRVMLSLQARDVARPDADEFGWTILSALVDDVVWRADGPTVHVEILKRRPAGR
ncbi:MAG: anti-sigma regulatory factor [Catenulispora sp.]|nr:anti-sigma regulatory factor [Catenulispora sp.]